MRSSSRGKAWGVCTARRRERTGVSTTIPSSSTSLIVSVTGRPGMTPHMPGFSSRALARRVTSAVLRKGRALSCTSTLVHSGGRASSPWRTESCLRAPPSATAMRTPRLLDSSNFFSSASASSFFSAGKTKTRPCTEGEAAMARAECHQRGAFFQRRNCLASPPVASAMRLPCPAARMMPQHSFCIQPPELFRRSALVKKGGNFRSLPE